MIFVRFGFCFCFLLGRVLKATQVICYVFCCYLLTGNNVESCHFSQTRAALIDSEDFVLSLP